MWDFFTISQRFFNGFYGFMGALALWSQHALQGKLGLNFQLKNITFKLTLYLEIQGHLASRLITPVNHAAIVIPIISLFRGSPENSFWTF